VSFARWIAIGLLVATASLAQVVNDTCAGAILISEATAVAGSTVGATTGPNPVACSATNDVWYRFVPGCNGQYTVSTCNAGTAFDTVLAVWNGAGGCGSPVLIACNDNNCVLTGATQASRVTFTASAGGVHYVSVGGKLGVTGAFTLRVDLVPVMSLAFFNLGPGTLGYHVTGPPLGSFFTAATLVPGAFPFGWFYGVDVPLSEIVSQYNAGPPFVGVLSACGLATVGPAGGLPPGLTIYAVTLGFALGASFPTQASNPTVGVVP
jgi:hypothetical protein